VLNSHRFIGVRVDDITSNQVLERIASAIEHQKACNIVTVNPELIMTATKNKDFKAIIDHADMVTPDGVGLRIMGFVTGRRLKQRVTGVDLCQAIAEQAAQHGWRIYLLGAAPGVAQQAATNLTIRYPKLQIVGASSNNPDPQGSTATLADIAKAKPNILLVAYGSPRQELWINKYREQFDPMITIGVGGSFDFIANQSKRAPTWVQSIGLEWLWRLAHEPRRWRRMLALPKFAILSLFK